MQIIILGSGGFQTIPRPLCQCRVCKEARSKGVPYSRNGPSIYIEEIHSIFDTPKDIINSLNRENIKRVDNIFYTHWHPDHTEGMRVVEEITSDWSQKKPFELKNHLEPIRIFAPSFVLQDMRKIAYAKGSYVEFFESQNFVRCHAIDEKRSFGTISVLSIRINDISTAYLLEENGKKFLYMPCDIKPFGEGEFLDDLSLLIVGSPFFESGEGLKNIEDDHPLREELFSMEEIIDMIERHRIKKTVITHIEEMWRLSYDEYGELEEKYKDHDIRFAHDGLQIKI